MRVGQSRKRDGNEEAIVKALQAAGAQVLRLGVKDAPDLLVRVSRLTTHPEPNVWVSQGPRLLLLEVKTARGRIKAGQSAFHTLWPETVIVRSVAEALAAIGAVGIPSHEVNPY